MGVVDERLEVEENAGFIRVDLIRKGDLSKPTRVYCYTTSGNL